MRTQVRNNRTPQWSEAGDFPSVLLGAPASELPCFGGKAGLDGRAQLSAVLKFPSKQGLDLGSEPPPLQQLRLLERWS